MLTTGLILGLLAYLLTLIPRCAFRIAEGHVGVVTSLGAALRSSDGPKRLRLFTPGLHFKAPWQKARSVPLMEEIIDLSGTQGARTAMAEDGTVLRLDAVLRYLPVSDHLYNFVFDLRSPKEHITTLFTCLLRNEIANFRPQPNQPETPGGSYALLRRERGKLNREIMAYCQNEIGPQYGLRFSAVDLIDIRPPEELDEALNAAVHAQMEAESAYSHAEATAQRRVIAAREGVDIAKTKAAAAEQEILTLALHLGELDKAKTLDLYLARRSAEVLSQSRHHYVRRGR
jgi:regulator of protease activity HflC (stomatin/prohibitin superfamily)